MDRQAKLAKMEIKANKDYPAIKAKKVFEVKLGQLANTVKWVIADLKVNME